MFQQYSFFEQRLYLVDIDGLTEPQPITPANKMRYADMAYDAARERVICIVEDHSAGADATKVTAQH